MEKAAILVICSRPEILQTIIRLIDANPEWNAAGAISEAEAIGLCQTRRFNLVLLGSGMDNTSASRLKAAYPDIKLIQHYGGGSGLLSAEIYGALRKEDHTN